MGPRSLNLVVQRVKIPVEVPVKNVSLVWTHLLGPLGTYLKRGTAPSDHLSLLQPPRASLPRAQVPGILGPQSSNPAVSKSGNTSGGLVKNANIIWTHLLESLWTSLSPCRHDIHDERSSDPHSHESSRL